MMIRRFGVVSTAARRVSAISGVQRLASTTGQQPRQSRKDQQQNAPARQPEGKPDAVDGPKRWAHDITGRPNPGVGNVLISYFVIGVAFTFAFVGLYEAGSFMMGGTPRTTTVRADSATGRALIASEQAQKQAGGQAKPPKVSNGGSTSWEAAAGSAIANSGSPKSNDRSNSERT